MRTLILLLVCAAQAIAQQSDEMLSRAISLAAAGRIGDAEQVLLDAQAAFPRDARFPTELAGIAFRQDQPSQAKAYLRQGLRLDPANSYAYEFLGSLYLLEGNLYAALKYLNRVRRPVLSGVAFQPEPPLGPELIASLSAVSAGQLLTGSRLARTERNLERLRIFPEARLELTPAQGDEYNLTIRSTALSQPLSGAPGRLLPLLRGLPYQQVNLDWLNIGRRAISLTSLWRWDPDKRRIAVAYRVPMAGGAYSLWTDLRDEDWDLNRGGVASHAAGVRSAAMGGEMDFDLGGGSRWTPGFHLSRHTFRNGNPQFWFANSTVWEVRNRLGLPRWRYADRRFHVDSALTLRTGRVFSGESSRLIGAEFDANARWLPQQRDDLYQVQTRLRGGALSGRPPVDALYITAMERDNDLWLRGHPGTRHGRKGNPPMGTRFVLLQAETMRRVLRMPLLRIDAGPFLDIGNTGGGPGLGSAGWLYDAGVQAVITMPGGLRFSVIYGRDFRDGRNALYTAVSR